MGQITIDLPNQPLSEKEILGWAKNFQATLYNKLIELNYLLSSPVSSHNHIKAHITDTPWGWTDVSKAGSNLTDIVTRLHSSLQGIGANDHHNQLHAATHHVGGGDLLAHQSIPGSGTLTHATIDGYLDQAVKISSGPSFADIKVLSPWVDVRSYASFSAAVDAIGSAEKTLLIPNEQAVAVDKTVPSNITLKFLQGGSLNIATGVTVTINGHVEAGLYQIFKWTGTGKVVFGAGAVKEVYPEWWGAKGDGSTDCTEAFSQAIIAAVGKITVRLTGSQWGVTFYMVDQIELIRNTQLLGVGYYSTYIRRRNTSLTGHFIRMESGGLAIGLKLSGFTVQCQNLGTDLDGINLGTEIHGTSDYAQGSTLDTVRVEGATGYGFRLWCNVGEIRNIWAMSNKVGILFEGGNIYGYNINAEGNLNEDIIIASNDTFLFGVQTEGDGTPDATKNVIEIQNQNVNLFGVYSNHGVARNAVVKTNGRLGVVITGLRHLNSTYPTYLIDDFEGTGKRILNSGVYIRPLPFFTGREDVLKPHFYLFEFGDAIPANQIRMRGATCFQVNPSAGGSPGWVCVNRQDTTIRIQAEATDTIIEVTATTNMLASDIIGIVLDNGVIHWTTIASITDADTLVIAAGIPAGRYAAVGAAVYTNRWKAMAILAA